MAAGVQNVSTHIHPSSRPPSSRTPAAVACATSNNTTGRCNDGVVGSQYHGVPTFGNSQTYTVQALTAIAPMTLPRMARAF